MGLNLNQVIIAGNLTRDPEIRSLAEGRMVVNFSIANNRRRKNHDGVVTEEVTFIDCEAWARTGEMVGQYLTKGSPCILVGRLKQENWVDKDNGAKRSRLKLVVENVQFLGNRRDETEGDDVTSSGDETGPASGGQPRSPRARQDGQAYRTLPMAGGTAVLDEPPF
jgi:single-strand DNA-binding protein